MQPTAYKVVKASQYLSKGEILLAIQIIREVSADVVKRGATRAVYAKQNDLNSRFLNVRIQEEGKDIKVDPTLKVLLNVQRPDNKENIFYGTVNEEGTVQVPLTSWMLELPGTLLCDISLVAEDSKVAKLTTMQFNIYVEEATISDGSIVETTEYSVIVDLLYRTTDAENRAVHAAESAEQAAQSAEQLRKACEDATAAANGAASKANDKVQELANFENAYVKKAPMYQATPDTLADVIKTAEANATIQLTAGEYDLLNLVGKDAYPEGLTIVGGAGVTMAGISITSGVENGKIPFASDISSATLPKNLTVKDLIFTDSFCLRNAGVDGLKIIKCSFNNGCIEITPNNFSNKYGKDGSGSTATRYEGQSVTVKNVLIRECVFKNAAAAAGDSAIYIQGPENLTIHKNTIENAGYNGIQIVSVRDRKPTGKIRITTNTVRNTGSTAIVVKNLQDAVVSIIDNKIYNCGAKKDRCIVLADCKNTRYLFERTDGWGDNLYEEAIIAVGNGIVVENMQSYETLVAKGNSNGWNWCKRSNGVAELWGNVVLPKVTDTSFWKFENLPFPITSMCANMTLQLPQDPYSVDLNLYYVVDSDSSIDLNATTFDTGYGALDHYNEIVVSVHIFGNWK